MLKISFTNQYLKDLELIKRRNLPKSELDEIVKLLSEEKSLTNNANNTQKINISFLCKIFFHPHALENYNIFM